MKQPKETAKQYEGAERAQTFVKRWGKNPDYGLRDNRRYVDTPQWRYCLRRFRQYWDAQGKFNRAVPHSQRNEDGDEGWFFPAIWVQDYADDDRLHEFPRIPLRRADGMRPKPGGGFPDQKELKRWKLPPGAIIDASDATVRYPDGTVESWFDIRWRGRREAA